MNEELTNRPDKVDEELRLLSEMSDEEIDTSDIPEIRDWRNAERGKFCRPNAEHQIPIYLDSEVLEFIATRAAAKRVGATDLANEMLKKDIELIRSAESG